MKTILVPTDFSDTSRNAANYAVKLAEQLNTEKIILFNSYQAPIVTEPTMPVVQMIDMDSMKQISSEGLEKMKLALKPFCPPNVEIETMNEFALLADNINDICEKTQADLIVMGISGGSKIEEVLIGSTALSVIHNTKTPVLVIPPNAKFTKIEEVILACDFKKVVETTPVEPLKKMLDETGAKLFVVNIDHNQKGFTADAPYQSLMLDTLLQNYNPEYHFIDSEDFVGAINDFAQKHEVDMVITIPKKHGFFESLFKESHTKKLAFHTHVPLLCMHEEDL